MNLYGNLFHVSKGVGEPEIWPGLKIAHSRISGAERHSELVHEYRSVILSIDLEWIPSPGEKRSIM